MDFLWYAMDERGFVAEVESIAPPLPSGAVDPFRVVGLESALHCRPELARRLFRYRERTSCEHRTHVRCQQPQTPLKLEELLAACPIAETTVRVVAVDFYQHDAFVPEEVVDESPQDAPEPTVVAEHATASVADDWLT